MKLGFPNCQEKKDKRHKTIDFLEVPNLRKEKILCTEVAKLYGKSESSIREVVKGKEIHARFAVKPQTTSYGCNA